MKTIVPVTLSLFLILTACNPSENVEQEKKTTSQPAKKQGSTSGSRHWKGTFSNGMKGAQLSFDVDGNELKNLTFQGYWRCDGKLDLTTLGPEKSFTINSGKVDGVIVEPEDGAAPFHYELHGVFNGEGAEGTLAINNVAAGCTTYKLNWTAEID